MKKFTEEQIYGVPNWFIQGGVWPDYLQQLMKNQNEIIDWIEGYHKGKIPYALINWKLERVDI